MCVMNKKRELVLCFFLVVHPIHAQESASTEITAQAQEGLVRDLIQQENQRLAQGITGVPTQAGAVLEREIKPQEPELIAMYGVGKKVLAEVSFKGQPYLYIRGQTWPLGDVNGSSQLRLLSMSSRCTHLAFQKTEFNLCVTPQGGQR